MNRRHKLLTYLRPRSPHGANNNNNSDYCTACAVWKVGRFPLTREGMIWSREWKKPTSKQLTALGTSNTYHNSERGYYVYHNNDTLFICRDVSTQRTNYVRHWLWHAETDIDELRCYLITTVKKTRLLKRDPAKATSELLEKHWVGMNETRTQQ